MTPQQVRTLKRLGVALALFAALVLWLLYTEGAAIVQGGQSTITEVVQLGWAHQPWVFLLLGGLLVAIVAFLAGHFFAAPASHYDRMRKGGLLIALASLPWLIGCKDCEKLQAALVAARSTGNAALIEAAETAWAKSGCSLPAPNPTPTPPVPVNLCKDHPDLCDDGSVCKDTPLGPVCEPKDCPAVCPNGLECRDPVMGCVPKPPPPASCANVDCKPGHHCVDTSTGSECVADPPPPQFPVRFPKPGVRVYSNNHKYGNGLDGTPRIGGPGDPELCQILHHVPVPNGDCHFDSDVWRGDSVLRGLYEMHVLAGARDGGPPVVPLGLVWEYRSGSERGRCHDDRASAAVSCDHFGNATQRDDPQTPAFEGLPAELGAQRDAFGPYAGFFTMPNCTQGRECSVRSCPPLAEGDDSACGPWTSVDWR